MARDQRTNLREDFLGRDAFGFFRLEIGDAQGGEIALVTRDGEPIFMAVPMGAGLDARKIRLEIAVSLFDREQISIGVASGIAGLAISKMIDELGRRRIPVVRYSKEELAEELKHFRDLSGRR